MISVEETTTVNPICPHCEKEITKVYARRVESVFGVRFVYFCIFCRKVLGISQRKGFWMG
ncbi:MAG: hypothetical protein V1720_03695 [bacterium]